MTVRELYEWAKERDVLDSVLCISVYSEETRFGATYEDNYFDKNDVSTTFKGDEVVIQIG